VYNQVLSKMPEPTLGLYMIQTVLVEGVFSFGFKVRCSVCNFRWLGESRHG